MIRRDANSVFPDWTDLDLPCLQKGFHNISADDKEDDICCDGGFKGQAFKSQLWLKQTYFCYK